MTRTNWAASQLAIAATTGIGILTAVAAGSAVTSGKPTLALLSLAYLPAILLLVGIATLLIGWAPRAATAVSWTLLGLLLLADLLGEFAILPPALIAGISPYAATFSAMVGSGLPQVAVALTFAAMTLAALGIAGLRRRDLQLG